MGGVLSTLSKMSGRGFVRGGCYVLHSFDMVITWTFVLVFDLDNNENNNFITVYNLSLIEIPNHNGVNSYKIKVGKKRDYLQVEYGRSVYLTYSSLYLCHVLSLYVVLCQSICNKHTI